MKPKPRKATDQPVDLKTLVEAIDRLTEAVKEHGTALYGAIYGAAKER